MHSTQPLYPSAIQEQMKNFMFLINKYLYEILNPWIKQNCKKNLKTFRKQYWMQQWPDIFWGDRFQQKIWERGWAGGALSYPLMGPGQSPDDDKAAKLPETPISSKDLVLWNHKLLIKIYPPQPVIKLIQHIFSKILPKIFKSKKNSSLSDCNGTRTHNHLVHKQTLNHLGKMGSSPLAVT